MTGHVRTAGRALVLTPDRRVLLVRGVDPADDSAAPFWFTPGGGLDPGETVEAAVVRELREELGLDVEAVGPLVMRRRDRFRLGGEWYTQSEEIHIVEVAEAFEPRPVALEALELAVITGFGWFAVDELRALDEDVYPADLAALLDHIRRQGAPDPPWIDDRLTPEG